MLEWETVPGGRARAVAVADEEGVWVRVSDDGTVHFFTGLADAADLETAQPVGDLYAYLERLTAMDAIDIVCRSFGGEDPGPVADG